MTNEDIKACLSRVRLDSFKNQSESAMNELIAFYAKDQIIGRSIHDAYRKAILAAIEGEEKVGEMITEIRSTVAVLPNSENQLQLVDGAVESFSKEVKTTTDSIELLSQSDPMTALLICKVAHIMIRRIKNKRLPGRMTEEQFLVERESERDQMRRDEALVPMNYAESLKSFMAMTGAQPLHQNK